MVVYVNCGFRIAYYGNGLYRYALKLVKTRNAVSWYFVAQWIWPRAVLQQLEIDPLSCNLFHGHKKAASFKEGGFFLKQYVIAVMRNP